MRTTRARWITATLAGAGCGILVAAPTGAFASAHHPAAAAAKAASHPASSHPASSHPASSHPKGLFIAGQGKVTSSTAASAFVQDDHGGEHIVTTAVSPSAPGDQGHFVYITKKHGAKKFTTHAIPGLENLAGGVKVEAHLSTDGHRVAAVFYACDGVYVADATISSARLPVPTQIQSADNCTSATPSPAGPPTALAVPIDSHQLGVLLDDPAQGNKPALFVGTPGQAFVPRVALPTTNSFVPVQITADSQTDGTVVVGTGSDGTNVGIYYSTERYDGAPWTTPKEIASLSSPTKNYAIESVTTFNRAIWIGLQKPKGATAHPKHVLYDVHIESTGQSNGAIPVPHTNGNDTALRMVFNNDVGHLHATWERVVSSSKTKKSGIFHEALVNRKWSKAKQLTRWYHDTPLQVTFNPAGHAVVSYQQR